MYCTRCGNPNEEGAQYCRHCAEPLVNPSRPAPYRAPATGGSTPRAEDPYPGYRSSAPPNYQPYQPYPAVYSPPMPPSPSGRALTSMILSIVSIVTCGPFLSIPGLVLGKMEMNAIREGRAPEAGATFAKVGFYLGIAVTVLSCLAGAIWIMAVLLTGSLNIS